MAALPGMPRLRPGFRNANSTCYRVVSGPKAGRIGLGDPIDGHPSFSLRSKNAAGAVEHFSVSLQDVEEIKKSDCADIPLGQILGGRRRRTRARKGRRGARTRKGRRGY